MRGGRGQRGRNDTSSGSLCVLPPSCLLGNVAPPLTAQQCHYLLNTASTLLDGGREGGEREGGERRERGREGGREGGEREGGWRKKGGGNPLYKTQLSIACGLLASIPSPFEMKIFLTSLGMRLVAYIQHPLGFRLSGSKQLPDMSQLCRTVRLHQREEEEGRSGKGMKLSK